MNVRKDFLIVGSGLIPNSVDMDGGNENIGLVSKKKNYRSKVFFGEEGGGTAPPPSLLILQEGKHLSSNLVSYLVIRYL